jgi:molybdenum cofactor guanylyltransferase
MSRSGEDRVVGAVLAGGRGRRMGAPKEGVRLPDGRAMIVPVLDALLAAFGEVMVVGDCIGFCCDARGGVVHIQDRHPGEGPLAGLEALLGCGSARGYVVAACDQPLLTEALLRRLPGGTANRAHFFKNSLNGDELDPLPGYFPSSWFERVQRAIAEGRRTFRALVQSGEVDWIPLSEGEVPMLRSINTPEDLAGLSAAKGVPRA